MFKKFLITLFFAIILPTNLLAFSITRVNVPVEDKFEISPAKIDFQMNVGQTATGKIKILNRSAESSDFFIDLENREDEKGLDFKGYSTVDRNKFTLLHGEQAEVTLTISLPNDFDQKDAGGVVFVSSQKTEDAKNISGNKILSRLGSRVSISVSEEDKKTVSEKTGSNLIFYIILFVLASSFYIIKKWKRK